MTRPAARLLAAAAVSLLIAVACGGPALTSPAATGSAGPASAVVPSTTPIPTAPVTTSAASAAALPPAASLSAEGGDPVLGQLGSFTWADGGSDSPWLPGAPIAVGAGEPLSVALADGPPVRSWTAVRTPATATSGAGAVAVGEGSGAIGFAVTAPGQWTVAVTIAFADGGSATWYWRLDVT
jgi:hypothetical protein